VVVTSRRLPVQTFIDRKVHRLTDDLQALLQRTEPQNRDT
jgi:hypothetical protein